MFQQNIRDIESARTCRIKLASILVYATCESLADPAGRLGEGGGQLVGPKLTYPKFIFLLGFRPLHFEIKKYILLLKISRLGGLNRPLLNNFTIFIFFWVFKTKWSKSEDKSEFGGRLGWGLTSCPPPQPTDWVRPWGRWVWGPHHLEGIFILQIGPL